MAHTNDRAGLTELLTIAIDIGASHLRQLSSLRKTPALRRGSAQFNPLDALAYSRDRFDSRRRRPIRKHSAGTMPRYGGRSARLPAKQERAPCSAMRDR
jgi:hypothetical protein